MAINKNFVVKNGLEVNERLILANADTNRVGIGTSVPQYDLHVFGGIGVTHSYVTGISTVLNELRVGTGGTIFTVIAGPTGFGQSVGVGTADPNYLLEVRSPVSTGQTALYVYGDMRVTGDLNLDDIVLDDATIQNLTVTENFNVLVGGIATLGGYVDINDSVDISGITTISNTTDSTSPNNGALVIDGGLGVEKSVYIGGNLDVLGDVSIAGTVYTVNSQDVYISNKDIILGYTTSITPNDDTANHAGIAIASTEGSPLTSFTASGINTLPDTYKQLMWFRSGTLGFSTDAFAFNYGVAIGTTTMADGVRLAIGSSVTVTDTRIDAPSGSFTTNLNVAGITTVGSLNIDSTQVISNSRELQNIASLDATTTATIEAAIANTPNTFTDLQVTGISTLGTVQVSSGIITATTGIVTYYGDGQFLENVIRGVGIASTNTSNTYEVVGFGATIITFAGPGISTATPITVSAGIATITFEGGGGGATIGVGTDPTEAGFFTPASGNLWYNTNLGRLFIYYEDVDSSQWVDAAPFNVGIVTSLITTITLATQTASNPSLSFIGDSNTGLFSPGTGQQTFVSTGASVLNINSSGINVTGIITSTSVSTGNIVSSGIVTAQDFDSLSDFNLKENITTVDNALDITDQLRGVRFEWKKDHKPSYGVIAQELEEILPELVSGGDPKTVNYNGIIGVLIEAIKELRAEVKELKDSK